MGFRVDGLGPQSDLGWGPGFQDLGSRVWIVRWNSRRKLKWELRVYLPTCRVEG